MAVRDYTTGERGGGRRNAHAWVRGPPARMPSILREMLPGQAALKTSGATATRERACQGTPEERAGGPRTQGASPCLSGRFANHPIEPCRRRTSIDSGRGMGQGLTAPTGHGGFHASPPAVSRSTQFYVIADKPDPVNPRGDNESLHIPLRAALLPRRSICFAMHPTPAVVSTS
jgi:hypothetical protein